MNRRGVGQRGHGEYAHLAALPAGTEDAVVGDPADHLGLQVPAGEDGAYRVLAAGACDHQHPLL